MCHTTFPTTHRAHGFTLIEQLVTLVIAGILVSMAIPAMANLIARTSLSTTESALYTAARLARTQAITHNTDALLCPSIDGHHCADNNDWQHGWIVALDRDHDGQPDTINMTHAAVDPHTRIIGSRGRDHIRFRADGDAAGTNITLLLCLSAAGDDTGHVVVVSNAGRIREARASKQQQARCAQPSAPD